MILIKSARNIIELELNRPVTLSLKRNGINSGYKCREDCLMNQSWIKGVQGIFQTHFTLEEKSDLGQDIMYLII